MEWFAELMATRTAAYIAGFIVVCLVLWQIAANVSEALFGTPEYAVAVIICSIALPIVGFFIYFAIEQSTAVARISRGMPEDGPMKINLRTEQRWNGKLQLYIDVKMTAKDWQAIENAKLRGYSLFDYEGVTSIDNQYKVVHLLHVHKLDFDTMPALDFAKDELIKSLYALRTRIDSQHEFERTPPTESPRAETLEI